MYTLCACVRVSVRVCVCVNVHYVQIVLMILSAGLLYICTLNRYLELIYLEKLTSQSQYKVWEKLNKNQKAVIHANICQWANSPPSNLYCKLWFWSHPHLTRGEAHQSCRSRGRLPLRCPPSLHLLWASAGSPQWKPSQHAGVWAQMWGRSRCDPQPARSTTCDAGLSLPP